uniref:F-box domain-containing protein n=1 Tax=Hordeum vulgare subsp. vulgare TaxID=112509 RepID=A0A8I6YMV3_HORVV
MPPSLPDDLLEEIFLRLPPVEPACLVHASLISKLWLGRLSSPRFSGRYREFHGPAPILGFVPTTKLGSPVPGDHRVDWDYATCDCRHGRLLLGSLFEQPNRLDVWDPMTGCRRELHAPEEYLNYGYGAAVLCTMSGCDHRACHAGPFRVVFVGLVINDDGERVAHACVSLPESGDCSKPCFDSHFDEWSEPSFGLHLPGQTFIEPMPPILVEGAPHFRLAYDDDDHGVGILRIWECMVA